MLRSQSQTLTQDEVAELADQVKSVPHRLTTPNDYPERDRKKLEDLQRRPVIPKNAIPSRYN